MVSGGKNLTGNISQKRVSLVANNVKTNPILTNTPQNRKLSFSFAYFYQYPYFGLSTEKANWFVSFIERLKDLSDKSLGIMGDYTARDLYRIHPVDWSQPNIPIQRKDLTSVPLVYRDNEDDYPFLQFTISKSRGRVAGFFDEESSVFYIVLLDPKHNLQPTKDHGYKVDDTNPLPTPYELVLRQTKKCINSLSCPIGKQEIISDDSFRAVFYDIDDAEIIDALKQKGISFYDAFCAFILTQL